jgi:hypothetical protein
LLIRISLNILSGFGQSASSSRIRITENHSCEGSGHEDQPPAIRIQQQQLRSARQYRLVFEDQVPAPMLRIRGILGRIRILKIANPTPFFTDFKDAKNLVTFFIIFSYNLTAGTLSSFLKI